MIVINDILGYNVHIKSYLWNPSDKSYAGVIKLVVLDTETNDKRTTTCSKLYAELGGNFENVIGIDYVGNMSYKITAVSDIFWNLLDYIDDIKFANIVYDTESTVHNTDCFEVIQANIGVVVRLFYSFSITNNLLIFTDRYKSCTLFDIINAIVESGIDLSSHPKIYLDMLSRHRIYEICYSDKMNLFITKSITLGRW